MGKKKKMRCEKLKDLKSESESKRSRKQSRREEENFDQKRERERSKMKNQKWILSSCHGLWCEDVLLLVSLRWLWLVSAGVIIMMAARTRERKREFFLLKSNNLSCRVMLESIESITQSSSYIIQSPHHHQNPRHSGIWMDWTDCLNEWNQIKESNRKGRIMMFIWTLPTRWIRRGGNKHGHHHHPTGNDYDDGMKSTKESWWKGPKVAKKGFLPNEYHVFILFSGLKHCIMISVLKIKLSGRRSDSELAVGFRKRRKSPTQASLLSSPIVGFNRHVHHRLRHFSIR